MVKNDTSPTRISQDVTTQAPMIGTSLQAGHQDLQTAAQPVLRQDDTHLLPEATQEAGIPQAPRLPREGDHPCPVLHDAHTVVDLITVMTDTPHPITLVSRQIMT